MATYEEYREKILLRNEAYTSFLYLDTRGFLTAGLGYLFVRDVQGASPGAAMAEVAFQRLVDVGIVMTPAQKATVDALANAMRDLPAAYNYPSLPKFADFQASALGQELGKLMKLSVARATVGAGVFTFRVDQVLSGGSFVPVEPLFPSLDAHRPYLGAMAKNFEAEIDQALAGTATTLTDSQRCGLFSVGWNLPSNIAPVVHAVAGSASRDDIHAAVAHGRGAAAPDRLNLESDLIATVRSIEDVFPG